MDRIERHDFVNAVLLAAVLLAMAFGLVFATRSLFGAVDEGLVSAEKPVTTITVPTTTPPVEPETPEESTTTTTPPKPPSEVLLRVGNGAGKSGVAGRATQILTNAGYESLGAKNSSIKLDTSTVYYIEGYSADAEVVANLLSIPITSIAPMLPDPGVTPETAAIVVILGGDTTL